MMCLKILLALLQSAFHFGEVGTETRQANECILPSVCGLPLFPCVSGFCVIVRMTQTQSVRVRLSKADR